MFKLDIFRTHVCEHHCPDCFPHIHVLNEMEGRLLVRCLSNKIDVVFTPKFEYLIKKAIEESSNGQDNGL